VKNHYINNKEFELLIKLYKENPKEHEDQLIPMFDKLIDNIILSFKFNVDLDDAKQDCFLLILKTLKNFNPEQGSAFNYFTTIIVNNLKLVYSKNKKYEDQIRRYTENKKRSLDM
jgi:DNA-directed RNA polymerase specialized sigma subunit